MTLRLAWFEYLVIASMKLPTLRASLRVVEKNHACRAGALRIASAKSVNVDELLVADKRPHQIALEEGLNSRCTC